MQWTQTQMWRDYTAQRFPNASKGSDKARLRTKGQRWASYTQGCRRPPGGGPGDGDGDDGMMVTVNPMRVTASLSDEWELFLGLPRIRQATKTRSKRQTRSKYQLFHMQSHTETGGFVRGGCHVCSNWPRQGIWLDQWNLERGTNYGTAQRCREVHYIGCQAVVSAHQHPDGFFARKVGTYKETEATNKRYVRGRQVLLMMHAYFSTNIKHGATYALQDLLASSSKVITFVGSSVIGTKSWLVFPRCLKPVFWKPCSLICRRITVPKKARRRKPMNSSWQRHAATWIGNASNPTGNELPEPSVPAHRALRLQLARRRGTFQRGTVSSGTQGLVQNDSCTFKHGKPPPKKDRSQSRPSSERGRSPSRDRNDQKKKKTSFGNKADAIEEANAVLVMRGNNPSRPVLPLCQAILKWFERISAEEQQESRPRQGSFSKTEWITESQE